MSEFRFPSDCIEISDPRHPFFGEIKDFTLFESRDDNYYSRYPERLDQTPIHDGEWTGDRGESKFIPYDEDLKELLKKFGIDGIEYHNGIPDFSPVTDTTVAINDMTSNRYNNFKLADEECAKEWNSKARDGRTDWSARDVEKWRRENGYTWHECSDMKTCQLVPTKIHAAFGHLGGHAECAKRDGTDKNGGSFDA